MKSVFLDLDDDLARKICEDTISVGDSLSEDYVATYTNVILSSMNLRPEETSKYFEDVAKYCPTTFKLLISVYEFIEKSFFCISLLNAIVKAIPHISAMHVFYKRRLENLVKNLLRKAISEGTEKDTLLTILYLFKNIEYLGKHGYILRTKIRGVDTVLKTAETMSSKVAYVKLRDLWRDQITKSIRPDLADYLNALSDILLDPELRLVAEVGLSESFDFEIVLPEKSAKAYLELLKNDVLDSPEKAYIVLSDILRTQMLVITYSIGNALRWFSDGLKKAVMLDVSSINLHILKKIELNIELGKKILDICMNLYSNLRDATNNMKILDKENSREYSSLLTKAKKLVGLIMKNATFLLHEKQETVKVPKVDEEFKLYYEDEKREKDILTIREETLEALSELQKILLRMNSIVEDEISGLKAALEGAIRISAYLATLDPMTELTKNDVENVLRYIDSKNLWPYIENYYKMFSERTLGDIIKEIPKVEPPETF